MKPETTHGQQVRSNDSLGGMRILRQYGKRNHEALGEHYTRHVDAMTAEGLREKSAIAAELAWRDAEIERLREALGDLLSWFPDKPSPPEWRIAVGASDAIQAAREAVGLTPNVR